MSTNNYNARGAEPRQAAWRLVAPREPSDRDGADGKPGASPSQATVLHRVLVCEDQRDTAETLSSLLRFSGHHVSVAHDGHSAIAQVQKWRPTAAIIDIGIPGVTGYGVAQHIRSLPLGSNVLLIAVTGYGTASDIAMARQAGFNWHFVKPAHPSFLLEVLQDPKRDPISRRDGTPLDRDTFGC